MPRATSQITALTAALLALSTWVGVALAWFLSPTVPVAPDDEIEAGGAFAVFILLVAPYLLASLWVVPSAIAALVRPTAMWSLTLTMINSLATFGFVTWMLLGEFGALHDGVPGLRAYAWIAALASAAGFLLALASVVPQLREVQRPHR